MNELEQRFKAFINSRADAENIDAIELPANHRNEKRADYFLNERRIIIELKSLESDPAGKIDQTLETRREDEDFPQFFGEADLETVLTKLSDGDELKQKIYTRLTRSIEEAIRSAKKQVASTRAIFDRQDAEGVVVLLNDGLEVLDPRLVGKKCHELLSRIVEEQERINLVWFIQSTHLRRVSKSLAVVPSFIVQSTRWPMSEIAKSRVDSLIAERAAFDGVPFLGNDSLDELNQLIRRSGDAQANATEKKRYEWWQEYLAYPYLRQMSDEALLEHTARIVLSTAEFFVVASPGGTSKRSIREEPEIMSELNRGFTHSQMELTHRVIDLRRLGDVLKRVQSASVKSQN